MNNKSSVMQREILFRGKERSKGYWVFGGIKANQYSAFIVSDDAVKIEVLPGTVGQYTGVTDSEGTPIYEGDIVATSFKFNNPDWFENSSNVPSWAKSGIEQRIVTFHHGSFWLKTIQSDCPTPKGHEEHLSSLFAEELYPDKAEAMRNICQIYFLVIGNVHDKTD